MLLGRMIRNPRGTLVLPETTSSSAAKDTRSGGAICWRFPSPQSPSGSPQKSFSVSPTFSIPQLHSVQMLRGSSSLVLTVPVRLGRVNCETLCPACSIWRSIVPPISLQHWGIVGTPNLGGRAHAAWEHEHGGGCSLKKGNNLSPAESATCSRPMTTGNRRQGCLRPLSGHSQSDRLRGRKPAIWTRRSTITLSRYHCFLPPPCFSAGADDRRGGGTMARLSGGAHRNGLLWSASPDAARASPAGCSRPGDPS